MPDLEPSRRYCTLQRAGQSDMQAVLESSIELRVESREAVPKIAAWLAERYGVVFLLQTAVLSVEPSRL